MEVNIKTCHVTWLSRDFNPESHDITLLYTLSKQKLILRLLKKEVFKVINLKDVLVDIWIFNQQFIYEIKNTSINKVFKKLCLVI